MVCVDDLVDCLVVVVVEYEIVEVCVNVFCVDYCDDCIECDFFCDWIVEKEGLCDWIWIGEFVCFDDDVIELVGLGD